MPCDVASSPVVLCVGALVRWVIDEFQVVSAFI